MQAQGVFFHDMPMRFYGGTLLSYACCFDLRRAILELVMTGLVSLNSREDACVISGFLPIHAVTANSLEATYDFITQERPPRVLTPYFLLLTSYFLPPTSCF